MTSAKAIRLLYLWCAALVAAVIVIVIAICYQWLDRPIALAMHRAVVSHDYRWWAMLTRIPNPLIPLAAIVFVVLSIRLLRRRALGGIEVVAFVAAVATIVTEVCKEQLKFLFGRSWPESWAGTNPSFIRDGIYGFHPLHGGNYNAFPSGHTATACAVLTVLWLNYPKAWPLWLAAGVAVAGGLVVLNYHFLSDVIAGAFLGVSIGLLVSAIWGVQFLNRAD